MDIYIYDGQMQLVGVCDTMISLLWVRRFSSAGSFEIYAPATEQNVRLLRKCRFVLRPDVNEMMYISTVLEEQTLEDGKRIIVSGYGVEGIFRKTIPIEVNTTVIKSLVPPCNGFKIPQDDPNDISIPSYTDKDYRTMNCEELARYALNLRQLGLMVKFESGFIIPYVLKGNDLSEKICFSEKFDNLRKSTYEYCEDGCCNIVNGYVKIPDVDVTYTDLPQCQLVRTEGLDLLQYAVKSVVVDPIIKETERTSGSGGMVKYKYVDTEETAAKLEAAVEAAYTPISENFTAEVDTAVYRNEFNVGDMVTVRDDLREISFIKRIEEAQESFNASGKFVSVTFGEPLKTIYDLLKE